MQMCGHLRHIRKGGGWYYDFCHCILHKHYISLQYKLNSCKMKKKVTINLSEEAIAEIQKIAKEERRSVSAMIEELIWRRKEDNDESR